MKYKEYMEDIKLTPDIKKRILARIERESEHDKKASSFAVTRRYISRVALLAACMSCLLIAVAVYQSSVSQKGEQFIEQPKDTNLTQIGSPYRDYPSADELSRAVGYTTKEVKDVPFVVVDTTYIGIEGNIAQITYTDATEENGLCFRMAETSKVSDENGDISGDYTQYDIVKELDTKEGAIEIKGNEGGFSLAIWQRENYTFSIRMTKAVDESSLKKAVKSVK